MTRTENLQLAKVELNDYIDINEHYNANMDIIDSAIAQLQTASGARAGNVSGVLSGSSNTISGNAVIQEG